MRPSTIALTVLAGLAGALLTCGLDAQRSTASPDQAQTQALVTRLQLTDLALFTEARYTRHPTQADLHSAFQDHPLAFEHFPSGSVAPPRHEDLARTTATPD